MLRDYADIIKRLGPPLWWDDNGCPRYDPFNPDMCGVYDSQVVLLEISCQYCHRYFNVALTWDLTTMLFHEAQVALIATAQGQKDHKPGELKEPLPRRDGPAAFEYGDPPRHGCIGDSMSSISERVLVFWRRPGLARDWIRDKRQEIIFRDWSADNEYESRAAGAGTAG